MGERPEEIRSEIEETRDRISAEIDELTERYSPGRIAGRKVHGARDAAVSVRARAGAGASGMRQRLTLRGGGHLGAGHTGNGAAGAAGARLATADSHGEWDVRADRADYEPYPPESSEHRHRPPTMAGRGAHPGPGHTEHDEAETTSATNTGAQASDLVGDGRRPRHGHGRELGLAGLSVAMAAVGARLVRRAGRGETTLRAGRRETTWRPPRAARAGTGGLTGGLGRMRTPDR